MAEGTLWLLTDQTASAAPYVAWVRRRMVTARSVKHYCVKQLPTPQFARRKIGEIRLEGFDSANDRILVVQDWEDDQPKTEVSRLRRAAAKETRLSLAKRFEIAPARVLAYLVPPTTEGWYLLVARQDAALRSLLLTHSGKRGSAYRFAEDRRWSVASDENGVAPTKEEVYACLGGVGGKLRKTALAEQVAAHLASPDATLVDVEALPPCLKGIARWLAEWG